MKLGAPSIRRRFDLQPHARGPHQRRGDGVAVFAQASNPKFTKCRFLRTQLEYLEYYIGSDGIKPSMDKIKEVLRWPQKLKNVSEVQQFSRLMGFVRMFIGTRFADMAKPLTDLIKKDAKFQWGDKHTAAVEVVLAIFKKNI